MRSTINQTVKSFATLGVALLVTVTAKPANIVDPQHVANGCHISASRYIAAIGTGSTHTVELPDGRKHTVAVIADADGQWIRDEFIGVIPVRGGDLQLSYSAALKRWRKTATQAEIDLQANEVVPASFDDRLAEVRRARELLGTGDIVVAETKAGRVPTLVWRNADRMCCYEPSVGTIAANSAKNSPAYAVAALTHALGVKVNNASIL